MTREEAIRFAEYAQILADGKPEVQEFYKLAEAALRAQQELESNLKALESNEPLTGWISVKERMPEDNTGVLIYTNETEVYGRHLEMQKIYHDIYAAVYDSDRWYTYWCWGSEYIYKTNEESPNDTVEVTHWMPLPEPPKGE